MRTSTIACIAGSLVAATAFAGPDTTPNANPGSFVQSHNPRTTSVIDTVLTSDDFESQTLGGGILGTNGWEGWFSTGPDHTVSNAQASSGSQSIQYGAISGDTVQDYQNTFANAPTSGLVTFSAMTYVATGATGTGYTILLDGYGQTSAACDWSWQISFEPLTGFVGNTLNANPNFNPFTPLVFDQWVEVRCEIDLDNNSYLDYYNNAPLAAAPTGWYGNGNLFSGGAAGAVRVAALDMYSSAATDIWMDDVLVETDGGCYADCDGNGTLNVFDYICFGNAYSTSAPYADCDGNSAFNVFDYICFGSAYAAGCP